MNKKTLSVALSALLLLAVTPAFAGWEEGVAAFKAKNFAQAAKEFQALAQERPEWPGGHYMLGLSLNALNRGDEALASLRKAYDLNPNDVSYQMALGKALFDNRKYSDAATLLGKINPSSLPKSKQTGYHQMLAAAYDKSGQGDRALSSLKTLADSQPSDSDAQYRYALAAFNAGQTSTAVSALQKAVRLAPNDNDKKETFVKVLIRSAREARGDQKKARYNEAATVAKQLASAAPTYDNLLTLGEVQLGAKDYSGAVDSFRKASSKKSNDWLVNFYLGQALTSTGGYVEAVSALNKALQNAGSGDESKIWRQLGFAYEKQKKYTESIDAYRKAGDGASLARVEKNRDIAAENQAIDAENAKIEEMEAERKKLEEELQALPGGRPPR